MNGAASAPMAAAPMAGDGLWSSLLITVLALAFVLALAWLFLRVLKRATTPRTVDGRTAPHVVRAVALGGRERLVVVRDGDVEYVLGVSAASVQLLDRRAAAPMPIGDAPNTP